MLHYARRELTFLRWLKRRPDIAIVHVQEHRPWLAVPFFRRLRQMGKRVFYTVHNVRPNTYPPLLPKALVRRWNRKACRLCDGLFVLTRGLRDQLSESLGPGHPPICVAPHGVWTLGRDAQPIDGTNLNDRLQRKRLLFFGVVRRNKGLHVLLNAMEQLPDYALTIAGAAREPEYLEQEILPRVRRLREMGRSVDFRNYFIAEEEVPALFAEHSAMVLPYTRAFNAQSGVVFLSLAYRTPVIASVSGGLAELFDDHMIGACFADVTADGVARCVREFFSRAESGSVEAEIRAAREQYSWDAAAAATIAGYAGGT